MILNPFPKNLLLDGVVIFNKFENTTSSSVPESYKNNYTATLISQCNFSDSNSYNFSQSGVSQSDQFSIYIDFKNSRFEKVTNGVRKEAHFVFAEEWANIPLYEQEHDAFTITNNMYLIKVMDVPEELQRPIISGDLVNINKLRALGYKLLQSKFYDISEFGNRIHSIRIQK